MMASEVSVPGWEVFSPVETMTALGPARVERLRELCRARLGNGPFAVEARAWAARGLSS